MIDLTLRSHCVWSTDWGIWSCSGTPPIWYQHPVQMEKKHQKQGLAKLHWWTSVLTYIRTDSINAIGYFREGIVECGDVCNDWFFIWRLNIYVWWGKGKPKHHHKCWSVNNMSNIHGEWKWWYTKLLKGLRQSYLPGPRVGARPVARLCKRHVPNLIGWFVQTHRWCQPCLACNREKEHPGLNQGTAIKEWATSLNES